MTTLLSTRQLSASNVSSQQHTSAADRSRVTKTATAPAEVPGKAQSETSSIRIRTTDKNSDCPNRPNLRTPADGAANVGTVVHFSWDRSDHAREYTVTYTVGGGNGKEVVAGITDDHALSLTAIVPPGTIKWRVTASTDNCDVTTPPSTFTTGTVCIPPAVASAAASLPSVTSGSSVRLVAAAVGTAPLSYVWYEGPVGSRSQSVGNSSTITVAPSATTAYWVEVTNSCGSSQSGSVPVSVSAPGSNPPPGMSPGTPVPPITNPPQASCVAAPSLSAVAQVMSGTPYELTWSEVMNAVSYLVDESTSAGFEAAKTSNVTGTSATFAHQADTNTAYFYRVRAIARCNGDAGPASAVVRVVVTAPQSAAAGNGSELIAPYGSAAVVTKQVVLTLDAGSAFAAAASETWMTVTPASGTVPADGRLTLTVSADPAALQVGSNTASVSVTLFGSSSSNGVASNAGSKVVSVPVSVTLITPVTAVNGAKTSEDTLIIPAVAHADGNNSHWQSDLRITHTYSNPVTYNVTYVPSGGNTATAKQTTLTVNPGETIALDDVLSRWFGEGALGESATGLLAIRPATALGTNGTTFAASRLYNVTAQGSFGQFVPALSMAKFAAAGSGSELALTSLAQSSSYRSNFGLVEGSGLGATVLLSAFDGAGEKLFEQTLTLAPGEHRNVGALLAANGVTSSNARLGAKVTSVQGSAFAYASVVDNVTGDPLFVPAVETTSMKATRSVIPGVAELATAGGRWQSDVRLFNPAPASVTATLSFFPQGATSAVASRELTIEPGQVLALDNVLANTFGTTGASGALHVDSSAPLVTNARTYNQRENGTYGQFIVGTTVDDATGIGGRPLEILQVEESSRFRSNVGLAEITGNAVTVEVTATLPGRKLASTLRVDLGPNEFRQMNSLLTSVGMSDAYNASLSVRVIGGTGRVTGYASVIDNATQDPTYVQAQ